MFLNLSENCLIIKNKLFKMDSLFNIRDEFGRKTAKIDLVLAVKEDSLIGQIFQDITNNITLKIISN
jgi:hypothetical protein